MDNKELQQSIDNLSNTLLSINNNLLRLSTILMNTKAKPTTKKPLKKPLNASLYLNATNKTIKQPSKDHLFDFSKIEYNEGSTITFSEFYNACCLDKSIPPNVVSREFKHTTFYKEHSIIPYRSLKSRGFRNIRLRLDTSNQQI